MSKIKDAIIGQSEVYVRALRYACEGIPFRSAYYMIFRRWPRK